jgi:hypothetical protein
MRIREAMRDWAALAVAKVEKIMAGEENPAVEVENNAQPDMSMSGLDDVSCMYVCMYVCVYIYRYIYI